MFIDISIFNRTGYTDLSVFVLDIINWGIALSALIAVIMVVVAGFKFIFSMGDEKKIQSASQTLIFAIIGLVLVFIAPMVIRFVLTNFLVGL